MFYYLLGQIPLWKDTVEPSDGLDELARQAFQHVLLVSRIVTILFIS